MGTPRTMRSARWKREANSLIFSHVAISTGVIDAPETPLYLASIASASNSGSCSCQISNLSTVTSRTRALYSERNASTTAVDADFSFRGEVTMFRICIFAALLQISRWCPATCRMCFSLTSWALASSLQDQLRNFIGLRDERQVTRFNLDGLGAHALGHEALKVRVDRAVLGRN